MDDTVVRIKLLKYGVKLDLVYGVGLLERIYVESFGATRWASQDEGCDLIVLVLVSASLV